MSDWSFRRVGIDVTFPHAAFIREVSAMTGIPKEALEAMQPGATYTVLPGQPPWLVQVTKGRRHD